MIGRHLPKSAAVLLVPLSLLSSCSHIFGGAEASDPSSRHNTQAQQSPLVDWPKPRGEKPVSATIRVKGAFDGGMLRYYGVGELGTNDQDEHQSAIFDLADGATLSNVIMGDPAADGIHCNGTCTLNSVWWERVGEDAATFRGTSDEQTMTINGGGASGAVDKVFQHNGRGTMIIKNFYVEWFSKLWRSCGNCKTQFKRSVIIENVTAVAGPKTKALVGVNENYGDVAEFRGKNTLYDPRGKAKICLHYEGNAAGLEPLVIGDGPSGNCKYDDTSVVIRR
jgi:pectate lyase